MYKRQSDDFAEAVWNVVNYGGVFEKEMEVNEDDKKKKKKGEKKREENEEMKTGVDEECEKKDRRSVLRLGQLLNALRCSWRQK